MSVNKTTYTLSVKHEDGDAIIQFPEGILNKLGWKEGDDLRFVPQADGGFLIRKLNMQQVSIDMDEKDIHTLMEIAHERDITFNQLVQQVIEEKMTHYEHTGNNS